MKVEFVMVADAAQVVGGKLYTLGAGWNQYHCQAFPAPMRMAFAFSILINPEETGRPHPVRITLADEGGVPILPPIEGKVEAGPNEGPEGLQRALLAPSLDILVPRNGRYTLTVVAGDSPNAASNSVSFDAVLAGPRVELSPGSAPP